MRLEALARHSMPAIAHQLSLLTLLLSVVLAYWIVYPPNFILNHFDLTKMATKPSMQNLNGVFRIPFSLVFTRAIILDISQYAYQL